MSDVLMHLGLKYYNYFFKLCCKCAFIGNNIFSNIFHLNHYYEAYNELILSTILQFLNLIVNKDMHIYKIILKVSKDKDVVIKFLKK